MINILILGLILWSMVHFIPSLAPSLKQRWLKALGPVGYRISFAVIVISSLGLIIYGWRHTIPTELYQLPSLPKAVAVILIVLAFVLLGMSNVATRLKRFVRHPQLMSVIVWASGHLLLNGDSRSVVLFSWLAIWALLETITISRREGQWLKPSAPSWSQEVKGLAITVILIIVAVTVHPYIAGVPIK